MIRKTVILVIAMILAMTLGREPERIVQESVPVVAIDLVELVDLILTPVVETIEIEPEPEPEPEDRRVMKITAYTKNDKGMNGKGITTNGEMVQEGRTIAADRSIPFGTEIYIPELGEQFVVTDRGGAIKGDRLDLFMESRKDAMEFGVRDLEVVIRN